MEKRISIERAQELLLECVAHSEEYDKLPLVEAVGRIAFEDLAAQFDQPLFDRSPLDGYAVNHADIAQAAPGKPVSLRVCQTIYAGDMPNFPLRPGEAARVMTGAPLPDGATCVIRQEDSESDGVAVRIHTPLGEYENYRFKGEELKRGAVLVRRGERLTPAHIGVLAGQGHGTVKVFRCPKVCVISTGSELSPAGVPLQDGKIYDSNRPAISARCMELGAKLVPGTGIADDKKAIATAIKGTLTGCALLVTTGGVSVGEKDYMQAVGEELGGEFLFRGIASKPGTPAFAMLLDGKPVICLSGNPFASYATFELLAAPVIRRLAGENAVLPRRVSGTMKSNFGKASRGRRFIRANIANGEVTIPESGHSSGALYSLLGCNCLVDIPEGNPGLKAGDLVEVLLF